ncbi:hypothetical protein ABJI51_25070 [Amycolatopsis sp. NEAU-NG30]|uniref:Uncharacterized protein n=1 Tax=Amycolatopsis melonis TaxID=3156488 RepID=A0ABV0LJ91_9PSEU
MTAQERRRVHHHYKGLCQSPHVNVTLVADAVERHYSAICFSQPFIADSARLPRKQITAQLKELDTKEENLIDPAADSTLPRTQVKEKLRDIARERRRLEERLDTANADLTDSAQLVNAGLALLEQPDQLYRRCNDQQRRLPNQAIFHTRYIEDDKITDGELHAIQDQRAAATTWRAQAKGPPAMRMVLARLLASGSYFVAFIQALVLVRPLRWS